MRCGWGAHSHSTHSYRWQWAMCARSFAPSSFFCFPLQSQRKQSSTKRRQRNKNGKTTIENDGMVHFLAEDIVVRSMCTITLAPNLLSRLHQHCLPFANKENVLRWVCECICVCVCSDWIWIVVTAKWYDHRKKAVIIDIFTRRTCDGHAMWLYFRQFSAARPLLLLLLLRCLFGLLVLCLSAMVFG